MDQKAKKIPEEAPAVGGPMTGVFRRKTGTAENPEALAR